jgi:hypothetical protein
MTLKEAVGHIVGFNTSLIEKVLIDRSQDPNAEYNASLKSESEIAAAYVMKYLANYPDFQEGQYSVNFDRASLLRQANVLFRKHGLLNEIQSSVKSKVL